MPLRLPNLRADFEEVFDDSFTNEPASSIHRRVSKLLPDHPFRAKKGPAPSADRRQAIDIVLDQSKMRGIDAQAFRRAR